MNRDNVIVFATVVLSLCLVGFWPAHPTQAQARTAWFSVTAGDITCKGFKIANTVPQVNLQCNSPRGGYSAGYSAIRNALNAEFINFGMTDLATGNGMICLIGINATQGAIQSGSLGTIQPNSAVEQCGSNAPILSQTWP